MQKKLTINFFKMDEKNIFSNQFLMQTCKQRQTFLMLCLNVECKRKMATAPYSHHIVMKCIFVTKGALCISKIQQEELGIFYKEILWPQYLKYFITYLVFKIWQFCTAPHSHRTVMKCKLLAKEALCISKIQQEELLKYVIIFILAVISQK